MCAVSSLHAANEASLIGDRVSYLSDMDQSIAFSNIIGHQDSSNWQQSRHKAINLGFENDPYWFKFDLWSADYSQGEMIYLELAYPHLDEVFLYHVDNQSKKMKLLNTAGDSLAFAHRNFSYRNFIFELPKQQILGDQTSATLVLHIKTTGSLQVPLRIWSPKSFVEAESEESYSLGLYFGIILVMILYNLLLFFTIGEAGFLYYVLYISSFAIFQMSLNGLAFQFLWPNLPEFNRLANPLFCSLVALTITQFTCHFLRSKQTIPRIHRLLNLLRIVCAVAVVMVFMVNYNIGIRVTSALAALCAVILIVSGVAALIGGYRPARYYVTSFVLFLIGVIVYSFRAFGILPNTFVTQYALQIGSALEAMLLSIALGDKLKLQQQTYQQEIESLNMDLIEKEKARTIFFHNTSHELRTPLNGILGFVEMLGKGFYGDLDHKVKEQVCKIGTLATSLMHQVNTILDLAKTRRGEIKLFHSQIPLDEVKEEIQMLADGLLLKYKNSRFTLHTSWNKSKTPLFIGDREKLMTIIRNLVGNAFKFTSSDQVNCIDVSLKIINSNCLEIKVQDSGIGIPVEFQSKIFDEFSQVEDGARRSYEGTGLGLAMVKRFVDLMEGSIQLKSKINGGSTFVITLKSQNDVTLKNASTEDTINQTVIEQSEAGDKSSREGLTIALDQPYKILIIDDNEINCDVAKDILTSYGYPVTVALSGREGLNKAKKELPDLILLDLMMPEFSGEDVIKVLKNDPQLRAIPVILLTARASQEDRIYGLKLGADDYLAKPIYSEEMILRVANTLTRLELVRTKAETAAIEMTLAQAQEHDSLRETDSKLPMVEMIDYYQQADISGGDWFGVSFHEETGRLYVLLGDVTGHGMKSAFVTLTAAGAFRASLSMIERKGNHYTLEESLQILTESMNEAIIDADRKIQLNMTMAFICLDVNSGEGAYQNAGHREVLLRRQNAIENLFIPGLPLGSNKNPGISKRSFKMHPGDVLMMYTDGLIENRGPGGERLKIKTMRQIFEGCDDIHALKDKFIDSCQIAWQTAPAQDDYTFLLIKWLGSKELTKAIKKAL